MKNMNKNSLAVFCVSIGVAFLSGATYGIHETTSYFESRIEEITTDADRNLPEKPATENDQGERERLVKELRKSKPIRLRKN